MPSVRELVVMAAIAAAVVWASNNVRAVRRLIGR
jgi:hypothetical protein